MCLIILLFRITAEIISQFSALLINSLFGVLTKPGSEESSHTMKGRLLFIIKYLYKSIVLHNFTYSHIANLSYTATTSNTSLG